MLKWLTLLALICTGPLVAENKILAFAGSTREDSCNKKLLNETAKIAKQMKATIHFIDLKDYPIPFYDGDLESQQGMPANAKKLRKLMIDSQAIIIASPEYNGSISAVLKNLIDWASRNEEGAPSRDAFAGKKFAIMSCSPGPGGGARGLVHLRTIIENIGGKVVAKQVTIPNSNNAFNSKGEIESTEIKKEIQEELQQLIGTNLLNSL